MNYRKNSRAFYTSLSAADLHNGWTWEMLRSQAYKQWGFNEQATNCEILANKYLERMQEQLEESALIERQPQAVTA